MTAVTVLSAFAAGRGGDAAALVFEYAATQAETGRPLPAGIGELPAVSAQASPAASFSLSRPCRQAVMPVTMSASSATVRSPASDFRAPWTGSQPSWVICHRIVDSAAPRSVSGRRSPQPSPRRRPRTPLGATFIKVVAGRLAVVGGRLSLSALDPALAEQFRQAGSLEGPVRLLEQTPVIGTSTQAARLAAEPWLVQQQT